jgi:hypothetical protein
MRLRIRIRTLRLEKYLTPHKENPACAGQGEDQLTLGLSWIKLFVYRLGDLADDLVNFCSGMNTVPEQVFVWFSAIAVGFE